MDSFPQSPLCVTAVAATRLPRSAGETPVDYILSITASANSLVFTSVAGCCHPGSSRPRLDTQPPSGPGTVAHPRRQDSKRPREPAQTYKALPAQRRQGREIPSSSLSLSCPFPSNPGRFGSPTNPMRNARGGTRRQVGTADPGGASRLPLCNAVAHHCVPSRSPVRNCDCH